MLTGNHEFDEIYNKYKNLVLKVAHDYSEDYDAAERYRSKDIPTVIHLL